jgi:hypothetical protein
MNANPEKEKLRVNIFCTDGSSLLGFINIDRGERIIDFMNDLQQIFVVVTDVEFYYSASEQVKSFKLAHRVAPTKKESIILQKSFIKWIEEVDVEREKYV